MLSLKPRPFVQSPFDMQAPRSHSFFFFFSFCLFGDVAILEYFLYHFRFRFVWTIDYVVRSFLSNGAFLPCDHGLDFLYQLM